MSDAESPHAQGWLRVGMWLRARRTELNPDWRRREQFARDNRMSLRTIAQIETHERENYSPELLSHLEQAYRLKPGSIQEAVSTGGVPAPLNESATGVGLTVQQWNELRRSVADAAERAVQEYLRGLGAPGA